MNNLFELVFSATGRTKKVANILGEAFETEMTYIDLSATFFQPIELSQSDIAIVVVPSYGGRVPVPATNHLRLVKGNGATALLVAVFGNRAIDDTLIELKDILDEQGFRLAGAIEAVAEHSLMPCFGTGRPDEQDCKELVSFVKQFKRRVEEGAIPKQLTVPGKRPYVKLSNTPIHPKANKACVKCGKCAITCPASAIPKENPQITDKAKCITCMRCVGICPQNARSVSSFPLKIVATLAKKQFAGHKENKLHL